MKFHKYLKNNNDTNTKGIKLQKLKMVGKIIIYFQQLQQIIHGGITSRYFIALNFGGAKL